MNRWREGIWSLVGLGAVLFAGYFLYRDFKGHSAGEILDALAEIGPGRWALATLSTALGSAYVNDFPNQGRLQRVVVQADAPARMQPEDLLKLYEKLRADNGGVGAAKLHQGRCEGCRLELNATEITQIRAAEPDEVLRCEECRRILVRTSESGL